MENQVNELQKILESIVSNRSKGPLVSKVLESKEIKSELQKFSSSEGLGLKGVREAIQFYMEHSLNTDHPQFMNQLWAGQSVSGVAAESLGAVMNTSMYTSEVAPVATQIELQAIELMGRLAGFSKPEGTFVPGASYGNMLAVLMGRQSLFPDVKDQGMVAELVLFCSEDSHYSFVKAANICGIGQNNVVKIKVNSSGQMDIEALSLAIDKARQDGKKPFFVGATAGTTVRGAFDSISGLQKLCKEKNLWFHVDGALGGTFIFSEALKKEFLSGLEGVDSFVLNLHKMLGVPLHCSALLSNRPGALRQTTSLTADETSYIFHEDDALDLGLFSLQCGRKADVLKYWLALVEEGVDGFGRRLERIVDLARYAESKVKAHPKFELLAPRSSVTVCFNHPFDNLEEEKVANEKARARLIKEGDIYINYGWVNRRMAWRIVPFNSELTESDIDRSLSLIADQF